MTIEWIEARYWEAMPPALRLPVRENFIGYDEWTDHDPNFEPACPEDLEGE